MLVFLLSTVTTGFPEHTGFSAFVNHCCYFSRVKGSLARGLVNRVEPGLPASNVVNWNGSSGVEV